MGKMKNVLSIFILMLIFLSCTNKKSPNDSNLSNIDSVAFRNDIRPDLPPPPDSGRFDGHRPLPPSDGMHPGGQPSPPPRGKCCPKHRPNNMRGFDPASEDDMDDNGMSRYMENNDEEGWD